MERNGGQKVSYLNVSMGFEGTVWKCKIAQQEQRVLTGCSRVGLGNRDSPQTIGNSGWDAAMRKTSALSIYVVLYVCKGSAKWGLCSAVITF